MEEEWIAALIADEGVAALAGARVSWAIRSPGDKLPAIVCHLVSRPRRYTFAGRDGLQDTLVQVDCWATDYLAAKRLARAVEAWTDAGIGGGFVAGFIENERDGVERGAAPSAAGPKDLYRTSLDIRVWREPQEA